MNQMHKFIILMLLFCSIIGASSIYASETHTLLIDGSKNTDIELVMTNDTTPMISIRDFFENYKFAVSWNNETQSIEIKRNDYLIVVKAHSNEVQIDNDKLVLSAAIQNINGTTYAPVDLFEQALDFTFSTTANSTQVSTNGLYNSIDFRTSSFEHAIRNFLGKPSGTIYEDDLRYWVSVDLSNQKISNTSNFDKMLHLRSLNLSNNTISNLEPLETLTKLKTLNLSNNSISSFYELGNLINLEYLNLSNNNLKYITTLKNMIHLKELYLTGNGIDNDDLWPLYYLNNTTIDINLAKMEEPEYDTWNLKSDANFEISVSPTGSLFWVPASHLGTSQTNNKTIRNQITNSSSGIGSSIRNLNESLRLFEFANYEIINDDKIISEEDTSREWTYYKPAYYFFKHGYGSELSLKNAFAYTLKDDYFESGVLHVIDLNGKKHLLNYLVDRKSIVEEIDNDDDDEENKKIYSTETNYYVFDPLSYTKNRTSSAVEINSYASYKMSDQLRGNVHKAESLMSFVSHYLKETEQTEPSLVFKMKYLDGDKTVQPAGEYDGTRGYGSTFVFLPIVDDDSTQPYEVLYDNVDDSVYLKFIDHSTTHPTWK